MNKEPPQSSRIAMILWTLSITLLMTTPAYAYVDPGSGGVIITTILGLIAAIGYTFRKFFYNIKNLFSGKSDTNDEDDSN